MTQYNTFHQVFLPALLKNTAGIDLILPSEQQARQLPQQSRVQTTFYIVKQAYVRISSNLTKWHPVSLFNESGNFLGPAVFSSKTEAEDYLIL